MAVREICLTREIWNSVMAEFNKVIAALLGCNTNVAILESKKSKINTILLT